MTTNEQSKYIGSKARITTTEGFIIEVVIEDSRVVNHTCEPVSGLTQHELKSPSDWSPGGPEPFH
jgi:hypothetical protein